LRQQLWGKEDSLALGFILGNDGASAHLAACACGGWNGDKMGDIFRDILVPAQQVIIVKEVAGMVDPKGDGSGHIHGHTAAYADDAISGSAVVQVSPFEHIGFDRVLVHVAEYFHRDALAAQVTFYLEEERQLDHHAVRHQERSAKAGFCQVGWQFVDNARPKSDGGWEIIGESVVEVCHGEKWEDGRPETEVVVG